MSFDTRLANKFTKYRIVAFAVIAALIVRILSQVSYAGSPTEISAADMQRVYEEAKTPYKYGIVLRRESKGELIDCPNVFRCGDKWYMLYVGQQRQGGLRNLSRRKRRLAGVEIAGESAAVFRHGLGQVAGGRQLGARGSDMGRLGRTAANSTANTG